MAIDEEFELDFSGALGGLASFASALDSAVETFQANLSDAIGLLSQPATLEVAVNDSGITDSVESAVSSASATVDVSAEASTVTDDVSAAVAAADTTAVIKADTTEAEANVKSLGDTASSTGQAFSKLGSAVGSDGAKAIGSLVGKSSAAASSLTSLAEAAGPVGIALAAVVASGALAGAALGSIIDLASSASAASGSLQTMFTSLTSIVTSIPILGSVVSSVLSPFEGFLGVIDQSVKSAAGAEQANRRLGNTFGQFAKNFDTLEIGSFSIKLGDLTSQLGLSAVEAKVAAARFGGLFATLKPEQAEKSAEQFVLLSASIIATGRSTDSLADTSLKLQRAIQTGQTRGLVAYGITLDATAVKSQEVSAANQLFGKSFTALSSAQQATATRQARLNVLTAQQGDIQENIARGAKDPTIAFNALQTTVKKTFAEIGRPLIVPVLDALRSGQPVFIEAVKSLGQLGRIVVPLLGVAFRAIVPPVTFFLKTIAMAAEGVGAIIGGVASFGDAINSLSNATGIGDIIPQDTIQAVRQLSGQIVTAAQSTQQLSNEQSSAADTAVEQQAATDSLAQAIGGLVAANEGRQAAAQGIADAERDIANQSANVASAVKGVADAQKGVSDAARGVVDAQKGVLQAEKDVVSAEKSHQESLRGVTDAERSRTNTIRSLADAQDNLLRAQRALTDAQRGPSEDEQLNIDEAQLSLRDALARQTEVSADADAKADDVTRAGITVRRAQIALREAEQAQNQRIAKTSEDVVSAQERVTEAQVGVEQADRTLAGAHERVADAQQEIINKRASIVDAQDAVSQAQLRQADASDRVRDAIAAVGAAQTELQNTQEKIAGAQEKLADADLEQLRKRRALAKQLADDPDSEARALVEFDQAKIAFPEDSAAIEARKQEFIKAVSEAKESPEFQQALTDMAAEGGAAAGQGAKEGIKEGTAGAGTDVGNQFKNELNASTAGGVNFSNLANEFTTGLGVVKSSITSGVSTFKDNLLGWIETASNEAPGRLSLIANQFAIWAAVEARAMPNRMFGLVEGTLGWISTAAGQAAGRLAFLSLSFGKWAVEEAFAMQGRVAALADNVLGWIGTAITEGPGKLLELSNVFVAFGKGLPGLVTSAVGDTNRFLFDKGKDILRGLLNGILDVVRKLPDFLGPLKDKFIDGFRDAFETHSPSRLPGIVNIGSDIGAGLINGLIGLDVVGVAESIARDAATAGLRTAAGLAGDSTLAGLPPSSAGQALTIGDISIPITVEGGTTQEQAKLIGQTAGDAFVRQIQTIVQIA